jgi:Glycosyl hydrolase family 26
VFPSLNSDRPVADARSLRTVSRLLLATLSLVVVVLMTSVPSGAARRTADSGQALFGMNVWTLQDLDRSESVLGTRAAVVGLFADWVHDTSFPIRRARAINARGAIPLISWEPWDSWIDEETDQPEFALRRIVVGDHDALIDRWAAQVARYRRPVLLRFAAEMNGDWRPWAIGVNGNRAKEYIAAWRRVRRRFEGAGATNAIWVWNPIVSYDGSTPLRSVFPGEAQVDWVAADGYNWGATRDWGWQSYADIFAPTMRMFRALAPRRPVMIAETGSAPDPRKPGWVADTFRAAYVDGVRAVVWFEFDKETDWRLSESPAVAKAARAALKTRAWRKGGNLAAVERLATSSAGRSR